MLPAHAGVIPAVFHFKLMREDAPRTRGGDPDGVLRIIFNHLCSPHTRG